MADGSCPEGPKNKKGRPFGSGTTNAKRRELRKEKQWSALEGQGPSSPSCLMKHLEALEKAREKCKEKLEAQIQAKLDGLEKPAGASSSSSGGNPPAKKQKSLEKDSANKMSLGKKGPREKPTLTPANEVLEKAQKKDNVVLEKTQTYKEVLEKTTKAMPKAKDLEKSSGKRPLVVVDWHNTLEVNNDVPGRNAYALTLLLQRADVLILSYVAPQKRHDDVLADIHGLPHWRTNKDGGKTDIACARKAIAIFDDCKPILQEAIHWGLQPFAIQTEWQKHQWLKEPWASYSSFADAVDAFIKNNFF